LDEVADGSRTEAGEKSRRSFLGNDCASGLDHVVALEGIVDLDARLDDIDGGSGLDESTLSV
jgi:hypothetical protein